jgi:hypothetical protein
MVQMRYNLQIEKLLEVEVVSKFLKRHNMRFAKCVDRDFCGLVLFRYPYVVVLAESVIENYLESHFFSLSSKILMEGGDLIATCVGMHLQDREELRRLSFESHPQISIFSSCGVQKMYGLHTELEAIDKLLPLIEAKGGLSSLKDGSFDSRYDLSSYVRPLYDGWYEKFMKCIQAA